MYTLSIEDTVDVPVKFTLKQGKVNKTFSFTLTCTRLEQDEIVSRLKAFEFKLHEFLRSEGVISNWTDQRLVLDAAGQPAAFNSDALAMMLSPPGVSKVIYDAYLKECGAKEKN